MAKKKTKTDNMMNSLLGGSAVEREIRKMSIEPGPLKVTTLNLPENWLKILKQHFKYQGLNLSTGIRQLMAKYMKEEGLKY